ncbi:hypothetical protein [Sinorhizobium meliloti]|uniref:hypothetical protein n=1 Tax=Rhizobium meliloti TaxID=382 RepID=UPI0012FD53A8|nr:hypothetical protein [Sinorhizobium meliloti]
MEVRGLPQFVGDIVYVELTGDRASCWGRKDAIRFLRTLAGLRYGDSNERVHL